MKPEIITLVLNILFFGVLAIGFLFGLRGVKKATSSLCSFIVALIVVMFLAVPVTNWVLNLEFGGRSINTIILDFANQLFGASLASNDIIRNLINAIPTALVSIVVCIVLMLVLGAVFKIIGNIIYRAIFGKEDKDYVEEVQIVNGAPQMTRKKVKKSKHRFLGGIVGVIHSALLIFVLFMPLVGLVNIVSDIAGVNEVSAEYVATRPLISSGTGGSGFELKPAKELLQQYLPDVFYDVVEGLDNSIVSKVGKFGGISEKSLNFVARVDMNGYSVKLGDEIKTLVGVYDEFVEFATVAGETLGTTDLKVILNDIVENPNNYDFNKIYGICDHLFESNLVNSLANDGLSAISKSLADSNPDYKIFTYLNNAVTNYTKTRNNFKDDVKAMLKVFEICAKEGLINELKQDTINLDSIANILLNEPTTAKPKDEVLSKIAGEITKSNLMVKIVIEATNIGAVQIQNYMNENITFNGEEGVVLPFIDGSKNITLNSTELTNVLSGGFKIYKDVIKTVDFDAVKEDFYNIFDYDLKTMINLIGDELNTIVNMNLFKETELFTEICEAMSNSQYSQYLSFNEIPKGNNLKVQFANIAESVDLIKYSHIVTILKSMNETNKNESIDLLIDELTTEDIEEVTLATKILSPILNSSILNNTVEFVLKQAHNVTENAMKTLVENPEDVTVAPFNLTNIHTNEGHTELLNIVNNLIDYAKNIEISSLEGDTLVNEVVGSDLETLGTSLDVLKNSKLLSTTTEGCAYNDIITALEKSSLASTMDFAVAKEQDFSWKTELTNLKTVRDNLKKIQIGGVGLVTFVLDGGNFENAYNSFTSENVNNIKQLFEIGIIKPIAVDLVNVINAKIKSFVGEQLGASIVNVTKEADLKTQSQSITNVIAKAIEIDFTAEVENIDNEKLNALLDELKSNADNDGVLKNSYIAIMTYIINETNRNIIDVINDVNLTADIELRNSVISSIAQEHEDIKTILTKAITLINSIPTDGTIEDVEIDVVKELILALQETTYTQISAMALNSKLTNIVIEEVNGVTGDSVPVLTEPKISTTTQFEDIIEVLKQAKAIAPKISGTDALKIATMTTELKTELVTFMNAMKSNSLKTNTLFGASYNSLVNYIATENGLTVEQMETNAPDGNGGIDWSTFLA